MSGPEVIPSGVRVAIAHDYLTQRGGAERVVLSLLRAFPEAPVYTTLYDPEGTYPEFRAARVIVSPLDRIGFLRTHHRAALPLLPPVSDHLRIDADVVIASSSGWAHAFPTTGRKLVYCHNPARWLYQTDEYLGSSRAGDLKILFSASLRPWLKRWDRRAASTADRYLANSTVVRERIHRTYGIDAAYVPPPHSVDCYGPQEPLPGIAAARGFYLVVSRLLPYKNVDKVIDAFRGLDRQLLVIGRGPLHDVLARTASANVAIVSDVSDHQLRWAYAHATALIAPSLEDFGLTPLEAASFGTPTLALHAGGYLDTIDTAVNGAFFENATPADIRAAVLSSEGRPWDRERVRMQAEQFSEARFHERIRQEVAQLAGVPGRTPDAEAGLPASLQLR